MDSSSMQKGENSSSVLYYERLKVTFLSICFFFAIGSYTLAKELGGTVFASMVGPAYIPWAKLLTMLSLIPLIFAYSHAVDRLRRYQVLCLYTLSFGIIGLTFTYLLGHPTLGLANTNQSPYRILGWCFYVFVEAFSPFIVSPLWAYANSVISPDSAKKNYSTLVSWSKVGGMLAAGSAWGLFYAHSLRSDAFVSDITMHQFVLGMASTLLVAVPVFVLLLMKKVPGRFLHGYEAVYQLEKKKSKEGKSSTGGLVGLRLLFQYPYVLGIFCMVYFYEVLATVISFLRTTIAHNSSDSISGMSGFLFKTIFMTHLVGFFIATLGTSQLLKGLGERVCLLLIPLLSGMCLLYFVVYPTADSLMIAFVGLKSIHYAFSWPVRESLYIPTVKEIKFKSKSWIDAFGSKFAKSSGSVFNMMTARLGANLLLPVHSFFFAGIIGAWFLAAFALGRRFEWAIANDEVIGEQEVE